MPTANFIIVDRKKDMILTAGYNVYPAEIERVIAGHRRLPWSALAPSLTRPKARSPRPMWCSSRAAARMLQSILDHCRAHLAAYKMPREVKFVPALPTTSSGKIMRRQLKTLDQDVRIESGEDLARQRVGAA